jgi:hypothetical protein
VEDDKRKFWAAAGIIALTIVAPALGGSTKLWAQGALAVGAGLLILVFPPRRSLGTIPNLLFAALLAIALSAFLPAAWFSTPDWKIELSRLGASFPPTRSPQPWLTLQWCCFLLLVLAWAYYLAAFRWTRRLREIAVVAFGLAILILSGALVTAFVTKIRVPFWPAVQEFGFFPNRNQTSNVLGLGAVIIYALGLQRYQEGRKHWAWMWFASLSLVCWGLIIDGSRAGIVLFFFGALTVHIYWWATSRDRRQPAIAFGGLILLIALFVFDGGATLARFGKPTATFFDASQNLRLTIHRDAIHLILKSSPLGVGLGNFWPIFAVNRHYSANVSQTAHPESDWVWGAIDLGWIGVLVALALVVWWIRQCPPFNAGTNHLLRLAATVCGIAFTIHGFFDVSGHRLGSLWPALFFGSLAIHPKNDYRRSKIVAVVSRLTGALLLAIGIWWLAPSDFKTPPTTATVDQLQLQIDNAIESQDFSKAAALSSNGLTIAPLDWMFYFKRGAAEAGQFESRSKVLRDFAVARYLLPNWPDLYWKQTMVWLQVGEPDLAFDVLEDGMRRLPQLAPAIYADIFGAIRSDPDLRDRWRKLGENDKRCLLLFLRQAEGTEFEIEIQDLLSKDSGLRSFTADELKTLFSLWYDKGDKLWLAQTLRENPEWKKIGWRQLAKSYADYQDYRQAYEVAAEFLPQPDIPLGDSNRDLVIQFKANPTDPKAGMAIAVALANQGKIDDALTTLAVVRSLPDAPKNLPVVEASLWAKKQDWKRAWTAIAPLVMAQ